MRLRSPCLVLALLAFALRAVIPIGFMPAADGSLSLAICPDGLPPGFLPGEKGGAMPGGMGMPGHQGHGHGDADGGHCSFCTGFSAAPPAQLLTALFLLFASVAVILETFAAPPRIRPVHIPQARAPPASP